MDKIEINKAVTDFVRLCEEGLRELRRTHPVFSLSDQRERRAKKLLQKLNRDRSLRKLTNDDEVQEHFALNGQIYHLAGSTYVINELQFDIDSRTWIFGDLSAGVPVRMVGVLERGGKRRATRVIVQ